MSQQQVSPPVAASIRRDAVFVVAAAASRPAARSAAVAATSPRISAVAAPPTAARRGLPAGAARHPLRLVLADCRGSLPRRTRGSLRPSAGRPPLRPVHRPPVGEEQRPSRIRLLEAAACPRCPCPRRASLHRRSRRPVVTPSSTAAAASSSSSRPPGRSAALAPVQRRRPTAGASQQQPPPAACPPSRLPSSVPSSRSSVCRPLRRSVRRPSARPLRAAASSCACCPARREGAAAFPGRPSIHHWWDSICRCCSFSPAISSASHSTTSHRQRFVLCTCMCGPSSLYGWPHLQFIAHTVPWMCLFAALHHFYHCLASCWPSFVIAAHILLLLVSIYCNSYFACACCCHLLLP